MRVVLEQTACAGNMKTPVQSLHRGGGEGGAEGGAENAGLGRQV